MGWVYLECFEWFIIVVVNVNYCVLKVLLRICNSDILINEY